MNKKNFAIIFITFLSFFMMLPSANAASSDEWTWEISAIPPDAGWDSAEGISVRAVLGWFEKETNQNPAGLLEHDIRFIYAESLPEFVAAPPQKSIAILNFASDETNREFVPILNKIGKPVLMANGEEIWLYEGVLPLQYIFSLALYRDYRTAALVGFSKKSFNQSVTNRISLIASRFSLNEEREAKICEQLFSDMNVSAMTFWTDASNYNSFRLVEDEIKASLTGVLFCYVGSMATREIWRGVRGLESQYQLWYPGAPNDSFLSYNGIIFADQSMKLQEQGGFIATKRKLWVTRAVDVKDEVAAGYAFALASWLIDSVKRAKSAEGDVLNDAISSAAGIPFGAQIFDMSPTTHRPTQRDIYMMRINNKQYELIETIKIKGLE